MKKGCFITVLAILTISIAAVIYFVKYHGNEALNIVKPFVVDQMMNEALGDIDSLKNSPQADSLKVLVENYLSDFKNFDQLNFEDAESFFDKLKFTIHDEIIDSADLEMIRFEYEKQIAKIKKLGNQN